MPRTLPFVLFVVFGDFLFGQEPIPAVHYDKFVRPTLMKYCGGCHDPADDTDPVRFLRAENADQVSKGRERWKSVAMQLRNRTMPPADEDQPTEEERLEIATWIDEHLRATACNGEEYAGGVTVRRLNRHEYDNTVQDLFGIQTTFSESFPTDGSGGEGFDNNGETLFLPPLLMERYLESAQQILDEVIITPRLKKTFSTTDFIPESAKSGTSVSLKAGRETGVLLTTYVKGTYRYVVKLKKENAERLVILKVDGIPVERIKIEKEADEFSGELRLGRGLHSIGVRLPKDRSPIEIAGIEFREQRPDADQRKLSVHKRLFGFGPGESPQNADKVSEEIISRISKRALRRPVSEWELDKFLDLYHRSADRGDPFEESVKLALKAVLVSPHFLFRIETPPDQPGIQRLNDFELATRLSYFVWGSLPDEELMQLADRGALQSEETLTQQVDRMLSDDRAHRFADYFVGQWLGTRDVGGRVAPDTNFYKTIYTPELSTDLREEPVYFFRNLIDENGSILDLIDGKYTFLTGRLAKHYGIDRVKGDEFRKVKVDKQRGGILSMGAVHLLTSYDRRTSPVLRGAWVLETLLGTKVPSPPADVPPLPGGKEGRTKELSLRENLEKHRDHKSCAACHNLIDPIGFGLENYDLLGRWREKDGDKPIDTHGVMPNGESFEGPDELKAVLLNRKREFVRHFTEKMLGYALGRSLVDEDQCTVERLTDKLEKNSYQIRTLIHGIVLSSQFRAQQINGSEPTVTEVE